MKLTERLQHLYKALELAMASQTSLVPPSSACLMVSYTHGDTRATVLHEHAPTLKAAWEALLGRLLQRPDFALTPTLLLRLDVAADVRMTHWGALKAHLGTIKRNYFREGIALDAQCRHVFMDMELAGNAMLYGSNESEFAQLHEGNFNRYGRLKYGADFTLDARDAQPVWLFKTVGVVLEPGAAQALPLQLVGPRTGSRVSEPLDAQSCEAFIRRSSEFLAEQVYAPGNSEGVAAGRFVYGLFSCFDRRVPSYNALRHASSTYAMIEAWEVTQSDSLKESIDAALHYLTTELIKVCDLPRGPQAAFLVDTGNEIKLGGNAVCILALCKYTELTRDEQYLPLMHQLAMGIGAMLNTETGRFVHVLNYPDLSVKEPFRIIYYDGEAAFALMRLFRLTRVMLYLQIVEKAFEYFIAAGHDTIHDHWLSYCVNELTRYRPQRRYFEFGIRNVAGHLDFVLERITTFPTLLELMMAAEQMLQRLAANPELEDLLAQVDVDKFYRAMHHRANYLLTGYFWPEWAMFYACPNKVDGSFFIRHHAYRVRIDDVEHYLSGLVAYRKFLLQRKPVVVPERLRYKPALGRVRQPHLQPWADTAVCFLNLNLDFEMAGLEYASLQRAALFDRHLNKPVTVLTAAYNPHASAAVLALREQGRLSDRTTVVNLFDSVQEIPDGLHTLGLTVRLVIPEGGTRQAVANSTDFKVHDAQGRLLMYAVHHGRTGRLSHVNHFLAGRKVRRDRYDHRGFLSQTQHLDANTGAVRLEQWFRPDGSVALEHERLAGDRGDVLTQWRLKDRHHAVVATFDQEADLRQWWLEQQMMSGQRKHHLLMVDKNKPWFEVALKARTHCESKGLQIAVVPCLHAVHTQSLGQPMSAPLLTDYRAVLKGADQLDGLVTATQSQAADWKARSPSSPVCAVPHPYDAKGTPVPWSERSRFKAVVLARLNPEKRIHLAIDAFALVAAQCPQASLHIHGRGALDGETGRALQQRIEQRGLNGRVHLSGWAEHPAEVFEHAGLSLLTSEREGFALVALESQAHGCPVIAFDVPYGPRDLILQAQTGVLCPSGDVQAMARAMAAVWADEAAHKALSNNARLHAAQFRSGAVARKWAQALAQWGFQGVTLGN